MSLLEIQATHGVNVSLLSIRTRKREFVTMRKQASLQLWKAGFTQEVIAGLFNVSQPAVHHYITCAQ
jgi:hypothetical protein